MHSKSLKIIVKEGSAMNRSGFQIMSRLIVLVKPLIGYMILAITMGLIGHLCAAFITVFGGYAICEELHIRQIP